MSDNCFFLSQYALFNSFHFVKKGVDDDCSRQIFLLPVKRGRAGRTPLKTLIQATSDGVNGVNKTEIA